MKTILLALAFVLCSAAAARAHKPSDSYLALRTDGTHIAAQWDIALRDLDQAIDLDRNGDGAITWGEVRAQQAAIDAYALARLHVAGDGTACTAGTPEHLIDHHSDGAYAVLRFALDCAVTPRLLNVDYRLFFEFDPQHRGVLRLDAGDARTILFTADQTMQQISVSGTSFWSIVADSWRDGVWHMCAGFDHALFLFALLMPSLLRETRTWRKVVTAFSVSTSLALSSAALGTIAVPAHLITYGIAASPVVAVLSNAHPFFAQRRWLIAFAFGLVHGFSFASAFSDLPHPALMPALLGFNFGLVTGQIVILGVFLAVEAGVSRARRAQRASLEWNGGFAAGAGETPASTGVCRGR